MEAAGDENGAPVNQVEGRKICPPKWFNKIFAFIYLSHFLSSFGDRIWHFAVGLYLYYLHPCSLLLTAVYGLSTCVSLFLLGAPVGRWVDKSKRLKAARITILIQNSAVVISALIMTSAIYYKNELKTLWGGNLEALVYATIITIEITAELASMANKLVLEKDWIVVLARGDEQKLSNLNATMRTINLTCKILAPFVVGHLLDWFSYLAGAIFIASWNVVSAIAEYYLLHIIFFHVPELSTKRGEVKVDENGSSANPPPPLPPIESLPKSNSNNNENAEGSTSNQNDLVMQQNVAKGEDLPTQVPAATDVENLENSNEGVQSLNNNTSNFMLTLRELVEKHSKNKVDNAPVAINGGAKEVERELNRDEIRKKINRSYRKNVLCKTCDGWKAYFSHPVKFAGLGLACLYMTVLSFDNVTIGYLSSQGVSASLSGNLTAVSALIGILGSLSFPFFRKWLGKYKAGIFGFGMETLCLLFCVVSIIAPGSPFKPASIVRIVDVGSSASCKNETGAHSLSIREQWEKHSNIFLLMLGVVTARYGLWIADLSVTQTFQENVDESLRGTMGGVQGSLNQFMSFVKFGLTIVLPYPEAFGYLICLSWLFVFLGFLLFTLFVCQESQRKSKDANGKSSHEQFPITTF